MNKIKSNDNLEARSRCYKCYRPLSSCMCSHIRPLKTETKFIILMHPKEFKKTKNGTGHLTHLSLSNSELFIDIDFSEHTIINSLIEDGNNACYVLYPGKGSINLNTQNIEHKNKQLVIFLIDSTWPCSIKMLRLSKNLNALPRLSFTHIRSSQFKIKEQPKEFCLSTIESTLTVLEMLHKSGIEQIEQSRISHFLDPFNTMVDYQIECASRLKGEHVRFRKKN